MKSNVFENKNGKNVQALKQSHAGKLRSFKSLGYLKKSCAIYLIEKFSPRTNQVREKVGGEKNGQKASRKQKTCLLSLDCLMVTILSLTKWHEQNSHSPLESLSKIVNQNFSFQTFFITPT